MSTQPTSTPRRVNQSPALFYLICAMLVGNFLWRMIVMATEYPSRTVLWMTLAIDAAMIVGLVGIRKSGPQILFVIALIAGLGLFGIRMHGTSSWWTGHWHYVFDR